MHCVLLYLSNQFRRQQLRKKNDSIIEEQEKEMSGGRRLLNCLDTFASRNAGALSSLEEIHIRNNYESGRYETGTQAVVLLRQPKKLQGEDTLASLVGEERDFESGRDAITGCTDDFRGMNCYTRWCNESTGPAKSMPVHRSAGPTTRMPRFQRL